MPEGEIKSPDNTAMRVDSGWDLNTKKSLLERFFKKSTCLHVFCGVIHADSTVSPNRLICIKTPRI